MTPIEESQRDALVRAVKIVGGQTTLAGLIGGQVKQAHVFHWLQTGRIPATYCPAIERETARRGDRVRCEELCQAADWGVLREQAA